jgi:hypothetical protein
MDYDFETLYETINELTQNGYTNSFAMEATGIQCTNTKKLYKPEELLIIKTFRFDGMTNPEDEAELFAIEAKDGTKGTMALSYGADSPANSDLVRRIPMKK